jgi:DNA-binding NarL/FixJ family response regulator
LKTIRALLAEMPPMLLDIVKDTLTTQAGMEIVGEAPHAADLVGALETTVADVAIIGGRRPDDVALSKLLSASPRLLVVMLSVDGRSAQVYQLRPHHSSIVDISPTGLVAAIRDHMNAADRRSSR